MSILNPSSWVWVMIGFVSVISFGLGWLVACLLSGARRADMERILCLFADSKNWRIQIVDKDPRWVWSGKRNPTDIARRVLE